MRVGLGAYVAAALGVLVLCFPTFAQGRWLRAESPRFVIYSDGDERVLRDYVERLEAFDSTLRYVHGLPLDGAPPRKLDVYLVHNNAALKRVWPEADERIAGFYSAGDDDIFCVAIRTRGDDTVVQHEYTHHFMFQYFPYGYPVWLVEGYAEYFMTTNIDGERVEVGKFGDRADELLHARWMPLEVILGKQLSDIPPERHSLFYAQAWILTHYLMSDPARYKQMRAYMLAVGGGADPVKAMEAATGLTAVALQHKLAAYLTGPLKYGVYKRTGFKAPTIEVTTLPPSADDVLLESEQLRHGVAEPDRGVLLRTIQIQAAKYPGDRLAQLALARAQVMFGDRPAGETLLTAWLAAKPDDVEALQIMAQSRMADGDAEPARRAVLYGEAGRYLGRAYKADPNSYQTVFAFARTRIVDPHYPSDNTMTALLEAHALAPQVSGISLQAAQALMIRGRWAEAAALLTPIANNPHGGDSAAAARRLLEQARPRAAPAG